MQAILNKQRNKGKSALPQAKSKKNHAASPSIPKKVPITAETYRPFANDYLNTLYADCMVLYESEMVIRRQQEQEKREEELRRIEKERLQEIQKQQELEKQRLKELKILGKHANKKSNNQQDIKQLAAKFKQIETKIQTPLAPKTPKKNTLLNTPNRTVKKTFSDKKNVNTTTPKSSKRVVMSGKNKEASPTPTKKHAPTLSQDSVQVSPYSSQSLKKVKVPEEAQTPLYLVNNNLIYMQKLQRYETILKKREEQLKKLRVEKQQVEKDIEDRHLTFSPDLCLTRRDTKQRSVDEFIRDQESWYDSHKKLHNIREEKKVHQELGHTYSPFLSNKTRRIATAKNMRQGYAKPEDRLSEKKTHTQERLTRIMQHNSPTFRTQGDENSSYKDKSRHKNSRSSSLVNDKSS